MLDTTALEAIPPQLLQIKDAQLALNVPLDLLPLKLALLTNGNL